MEEYLKKRDSKAMRKSQHNKILKEGKDDDSYLSDAFEWSTHFIQAHNTTCQ